MLRLSKCTSSPFIRHGSISLNTVGNLDGGREISTERGSSWHICRDWCVFTIEISFEQHSITCSQSFKYVGVDCNPHVLMGKHAPTLISCALNDLQSTLVRSQHLSLEHSPKEQSFSNWLSSASIPIPPEQTNSESYGFNVDANRIYGLVHHSHAIFSSIWSVTTWMGLVWCGFKWAAFFKVLHISIYSKI